jgi:hypothetical protein
MGLEVGAAEQSGGQSDASRGRIRQSDQRWQHGVGAVIHAADHALEALLGRQRMESASMTAFPMGRHGDQVD